MVVVLAGSGNYVKELANPVTFCSFVEIKRIESATSADCLQPQVPTKMCVCLHHGLWWQGACSTHHSAEALNPNNFLVGQVMRVNVSPSDISDPLKKKSCTQTQVISNPWMGEKGHHLSHKMCRFEALVSQGR